MLRNPNIDINCTSYYKDEYDNFIFDTPLNCAIKNNNIEIVVLLLSKSTINVNLNLNIEYANSKNIFNNNISPSLKEKIKKINVHELFYCFMFHKHDNYGQNETALNIAVKNNNIEIIKILLDNPNIDINSQSIIINKYGKEELETPLNNAIKNENIEIIELLVSKENLDINLGPSKEYDGDTALNIAMRNGNKEIIDILLSNPKINVNLKSKYSKLNEEAPLHIATETGNYEIVKRLLSFPDIDVNAYKISYDNSDPIKSYFEKAPIHLAASNNDILQLLVSHPSIDINSKAYFTAEIYNQKRGFVKTALHMAIESGNIDGVKLLLQHQNIDVNVKRIYAYEKSKFIIKSSDYEEILKKIMRKEQKVVKESIELKTPLFVALEKYNIDLMNMLLSHKNINTDIKAEIIYNQTYFANFDTVGTKFESNKYEETISEVIEFYTKYVYNFKRDKLIKKL